MHRAVILIMLTEFSESVSHDPYKNYKNMFCLTLLRFSPFLSKFEPSCGESPPLFQHKEGCELPSSAIIAIRTSFPCYRSLNSSGNEHKCLLASNEDSFEGRDKFLSLLKSSLIPPKLALQPSSKLGM